MLAHHARGQPANWRACTLDTGLVLQTSNTCCAPVHLCQFLSARRRYFQNLLHLISYRAPTTQLAHVAEHTNFPIRALPSILPSGEQHILIPRPSSKRCRHQSVGQIHSYRYIKRTTRQRRRLELSISPRFDSNVVSASHPQTLSAAVQGMANTLADDPIKSEAANLIVLTVQRDNGVIYRRPRVHPPSAAQDLTASRHHIAKTTSLVLNNPKAVIRK